MNRRIIMATVVLLCGAGLHGAASDEGAPKKHRKHHPHKKRDEVEVPKVTFGNVTIEAIHNNAHHRVLFLLPNGKRAFFVSPGESRKVAALFAMTERKAPYDITKSDIEERSHLMDKGDHTYLLRNTPDGFTVHRIKDSEKITQGRVLFPVGTKDVARDLLVEHVAGRSKTSAFSLHEVGSLQQKGGQPKRAASGLLLAKK